MTENILKNKCQQAMVNARVALQREIHLLICLTNIFGINAKMISKSITSVSVLYAIYSFFFFGSPTLSSLTETTVVYSMFIITAILISLALTQYCSESLCRFMFIRNENFIMDWD